MTDFRTSDEEAAFNHWYDQIFDVERFTYPEITQAAWLAARSHFESLDRDIEGPQEMQISHSDARFQELALNFAVQAIAHDKELNVFAVAENFRLFLLNTHTPRILSVSEGTAIFQGSDGPMVYHRQSPLDGMELA